MPAAVLTGRATGDPATCAAAPIVQLPSSCVSRRQGGILLALSGLHSHPLATGLASTAWHLITQWLERGLRWQQQAPVQQEAQALATTPR